MAGQPRGVLFDDLRSRDDLIGRFGDAQPASDRKRSRRMVAGDHHRADAGGATCLHRSTRLRPRRIGHRRQAVEHQIPLRLQHLPDLTVVDAPSGDGEHPVPLGGELGRLVEHGATQLLVDGRVAGTGCDAGGRLHHRFDGTLGRHESLLPVGGTVDRDHPLAARIEGDLGDARVASAHPLPVEPELAGDGEQRTLGRIAHDGPVLAVVAGRDQDGVVAEGGGGEQRSQR